MENPRTWLLRVVKMLPLELRTDEALLRAIADGEKEGALHRLEELLAEARRELEQFERSHQRLERLLENHPPRLRPAEHGGGEIVFGYDYFTGRGSSLSRDTTAELEWYVEEHSRLAGIARRVQKARREARFLVYPRPPREEEEDEEVEAEAPGGDDEEEWPEPPS
jgi:hypothetical protein